VLLALGGHGGTGAGETVLAGVLLGIVAGLAYALYTYASSRAIRAGQAARGVMGGMFGLGALALLPVLIVLGAPLLQSGRSIGIAAYLALGPMFVAYLLFGIGMRTLRSSTATTITLLEPFVATLLAVIVVGERLEPIGWIGLGLILAAVTVLATARQPRSNRASP
jgi:DME family drug/metabolite transporter